MGRNIRINGTDYEVTKTWNNQEVIRLRDQSIYLSSLDTLGVEYTETPVLPTEVGAYASVWDATTRSKEVLGYSDVYQFYSGVWYKNDQEITAEQVLANLGPAGYLAPLTFKPEQD